MGTRGGRARTVGCYRLAMPIECAAELGRPSLLNPSCPPVSTDAEHAKKHERIRAHIAVEQEGKNGVDKPCPPKETSGTPSAARLRHRACVQSGCRSSSRR